MNQNQQPTIQQVQGAFCASSSASTKECLNAFFNWCSKTPDEKEEPIDVFYEDLLKTHKHLTDLTSSASIKELQNKDKQIKDMEGKISTYQSEIRSNNEAMQEKDNWIIAARKQLGVLNHLLESLKTSEALRGYNGLQELLEKVPRTTTSGKPPMKRRAQIYRANAGEVEREASSEKVTSAVLKKKKVEFEEQIETVYIDEDEDDEDEDEDEDEDITSTDEYESENKARKSDDNNNGKNTNYFGNPVPYGVTKGNHPFSKKGINFMTHEYWGKLGGELKLDEGQLEHLKEKFKLNAKEPVYKITEFDPIKRRFKIVFCGMEHEKSELIDKLKYLNILQACMIFGSDLKNHVIKIAREGVNKIYKRKQISKLNTTREELRELRSFFDNIVFYREVKD